MNLLKETESTYRMSDPETQKIINSLNEIKKIRGICSTDDEASKSDKESEYPDAGNYLT